MRSGLITAREEEKPVEIKISKNLLDSYRKIKKEIPVLELELSEMQKGNNGFGSSVILNGLYYPPKPETVVGFDWKLYEHRKKVLSTKKAKIKAIEKWIDSIEDGQTRCIFKMFYIDGMKWEIIASKTGYSESVDYPRLHIRDEYLKKYGMK